MLSVLSHVATLLPTPSKKYCKKIESIIINFIKGEQELQKLQSSKTEGKYRIPRCHFPTKIHKWPRPTESSYLLVCNKNGLVEMIRPRFILKTLHLEDLNDKSLLFNPYTSNEILIKKALKNIINPVMKQIYISLPNCKNKIIQMEPTSALFLPLFGESRTTKN